MKLLCWWRQRALARAAVGADALSGSLPLQEHLQRCPACQQFWQELRHLSAELGGLAEPLYVTEGFTDAIRHRIAATPVSQKSTPVVSVSLALTAACVLFGLIYWNNRTAQESAAPCRVAANQPSGTVPNAMLPRGKVSRSKSSNRKSSPKSSERTNPAVVPAALPKRNLPQPYWLLRNERARIARRYRKHHRDLIASHPKPRSHGAVKQVARVSALPKWVQWTRWGAYYESHGDYQRAAAAYGTAYAERPEPDLALAAGSAAENAGDVAEALSYYCRVLNQSSEKQQPQKGKETWTLENDTV